MRRARKWSAEQAHELEAIAKRLFRCDRHEQHDEYREQCGACVLRGYLSDSAKADGMTEASGPNYAGWARCYVQAQEYIPLRWHEAFREQRESDNKAYAAALARDIATWGIRWGGL